MDVVLTEKEQQLLDSFQKNFPLTATPYLDIASKLGMTEEEVIDRLSALQARGLVSRIGPVFRANAVGASTLAAMSVPENQLEQVAERVSRFDEVNHNYQRDHRFNLWFVAMAENEEELLGFLRRVEEETGLAVLYLPMLEDYHIDLGFKINWAHHQ